MSGERIVLDHAGAGGPAYAVVSARRVTEGHVEVVHPVELAGQRLARLGGYGHGNRLGLARRRLARGVRGKQKSLLQVDRLEAFADAREVAGWRVALRAPALSVEVLRAGPGVAGEDVARLEHRRPTQRVVHPLAQEMREHEHLGVRERLEFRADLRALAADRHRRGGRHPGTAQGGGPGGGGGGGAQGREEGGWVRGGWGRPRSIGGGWDRVAFRGRPPRWHATNFSP